MPQAFSIYSYIWGINIIIGKMHLISKYIPGSLELQQKISLALRGKHYRILRKWLAICSNCQKNKIWEEGRGWAPTKRTHWAAAPPSMAPMLFLFFVKNYTKGKKNTESHQEKGKPNVLLAVTTPGWGVSTKRRKGPCFGSSGWSCHWATWYDHEHLVVGCSARRWQRAFGPTVPETCHPLMPGSNSRSDRAWLTSAFRKGSCQNQGPS